VGGDKSFNDEVEEKFGSEIGICFGDYNKKETLNTKMAIHKWDFTHFMTADDLKVFKGEKPEKLEIPQ